MAEQVIAETVQLGTDADNRPSQPAVCPEGTTRLADVGTGPALSGMRADRSSFVIPRQPSFAASYGRPSGSPATGKSTEGKIVNEPLTMDQVRADVAELLYLNPSDVDDTADLLTEGLDSVRILMLVERWRNAGANIDFMQLAEAPTLAVWWQALSARDRNNGHG